MRVMVTGATGFVGYHTALALLAAGHEVSLLVRSEQKMQRLFGPDRIRDFTCGDITDASKVRRAVAGCDAVVHSAAMVSTHAADAAAVYRTNLDGTSTVIRTSLDQGVGAVIHVSSVTALYDPEATVLDENSPPGAGATGYGRSKVACERLVRQLQEQGAPLSITYPATVIGPDDPGLTEAHVGLRTYLQRFVPVMPSGTQYVDVRDIADVHLRLLEQHLPPGRFILGGHYIPWTELGALLFGVTGRKPREIPLNPGLLRLAARLCDSVGSRLGLDLPLTVEGISYATHWVAMDSRGVEEGLEFAFRPVEDSFRDAIGWLAAAGYITAGQAGTACL
ncbi:MAG: SDR family NAD(P)-dependent oxidoreductase [Pseudomonadales bacterium]|nr:SDR family NAD(P)-dependent oxidoreductase [Halioglobus sp.]MCP5129748.1 SDR family NAD(P)-dependent oxidoreductase [Pseudomonadales bacterium]